MIIIIRKMFQYVLIKYIILKYGCSCFVLSIYLTIYRIFKPTKVFLYFYETTLFRKLCDNKIKICRKVLVCSIEILEDQMLLVKLSSSPKTCSASTNLNKEKAPVSVKHRKASQLPKFRELYITVQTAFQVGIQYNIFLTFVIQPN